MDQEQLKRAKELSAKLEEAAKPLIKLLAENCHPHCTAIVTSTGAEILEGLCAFNTQEFIVD